MPTNDDLIEEARANKGVIFLYYVRRDTLKMTEDMIVAMP